LRPSHWWKNVPVAAPIVFGGRLHDPDAVRAVLLTFCAFCAVASAGYLVNDVVDRASDRVHPARRSRPVAAGEISPRAALASAGGIVLATFAAAIALLPRGATVFLALYLGLSLAYTFVGRRLLAGGPLLVALGFVFRVAAGSAAAGVEPSTWLLVLTYVLALALAVAKREAEARRAQGAAPAALVVTTDALLAAAALGYVAWTLWPSTVALHGTAWLAVTAAPVIAALARFRSRLRGDPAGRGPAEIVARDPVLLGLGTLWAALCVVVLAGK
jgi:decaprenyl-phosphate phosphoribosyltransferase